MNSYKITGTLIQISAVEEISEKFKKQLAIIETIEEYPSLLAFEFVNKSIQTLSDFAGSNPKEKIGQKVTVEFFVNGREYNGKYYTSLRGWKIGTVESQPAPNDAFANEVPF